MKHELKGVLKYRGKKLDPPPHKRDRHFRNSVTDVTDIPKTSHRRDRQLGKTGHRRDRQLGKTGHQRDRHAEVIGYVSIATRAKGHRVRFYSNQGQRSSGTFP